MKKTQIFFEEEKILNKINSIINDKLEDNLTNFNNQKYTKFGFTEGLRETQFNRQAK